MILGVLNYCWTFQKRKTDAIKNNIDPARDILTILTAKALDDIVISRQHIGAGYRDFTSPILDYCPDIAEQARIHKKSLIKQCEKLLSHADSILQATVAENKNDIISLIKKSNMAIKALNSY